jgi:hypothetical protein
MKQWAIDATNKTDWTNNSFHQFVKNADKKEFLESQIPFFYAVQAFPRMLCKLAYNIEDSKERLLVVNNIFEEHGEGQDVKFHTETYKTYLRSLGWIEGLTHNPWVDQWVDKVLNSSLSASELAAYLSGVEYVYALICQDVSAYLNTLELACEQTHYAKHSVLDWEHGYELLEVALSLHQQDNFDAIKKAFNDAQKDFLNMYAHLFFPTKNDMKTINQEKIAFYYIREDSEVEKNALEKFINNKDNISGVPIDVLSICSGGEHIFAYLAQSYPCNIDAIDLNVHQLELAQEKLSVLLKNVKDNALLDQNNTGKFEKLFTLLKNSFSKQELDTIVHDLKYSHKSGSLKLKFVVDKLFSNEYLNIVFGEEATKFTKKSFADHFFNVFNDGLRCNENNCHNIFYNSPVRDYEKLSTQIKTNIDKHNVTWTINNPKENLPTKTYDIINVSNVGDWMELSSYEAMLEKMKNNVKPNGCIVARKLLGDYSLIEVLTKAGFVCQHVTDRTGFYSETVVAYLK